MGFPCGRTQGAPASALRPGLLPGPGLPRSGRHGSWVVARPSRPAPRVPGVGELGEQPTHPCSGPGKARLPRCVLTSSVVLRREGGGRPRPPTMWASLLVPTSPALPAPRPQAGLPGTRLWAPCKDRSQEEDGSASDKLPRPFSCRACSTETEEKHAPIPKIRLVQMQESLYAPHGVRAGARGCHVGWVQASGSPPSRTVPGRFLGTLPAGQVQGEPPRVPRPGQLLSQASWVPPMTWTETSTLLSRGSAYPKMFFCGLSGVSENLPTESQPTGSVALGHSQRLLVAGVA